MANPYKLTYFVNCEKQGFTESWYGTADSADLAMKAAKGAAQDRANCIGQPAFIEAIRVSDETVLGDALIDFTPFRNNQAATIGTARDQAAAAILCRAQAQNNLYRRQLWMRAVPDNWIQFLPLDGTPIISAAATQSIQQFATTAIAQGLSLRVFDKGQAVVPITGVIASTQPASTRPLPLPPASASRFTDANS